MKKVLRKSGKMLLRLLAGLLVLLLLLAAYHHLRLVWEAGQVMPVGQRVTVDGYHMNVYTQGQKRSDDSPTVVLLSGSGMTAPIYEYKVLYAPLSASYRVAVIEKFGYGYADDSPLARDVATMVEEDRAALAAAGEKAPYVLMPHSMSALEAIYWAYTYPDEVAGIIGLDMAVPASYTSDNSSNIALLRVGTFFGLHRIPLFSPVNSLGLTAEEYRQSKLLNAKNALDTAVYNECLTVMQNAKTTLGMDVSAVPVLMFTTNLNGSQNSASWVAAQDAFAAGQQNCTQVHYECGHNLYQEKTEEMLPQILQFLSNVQHP